MRWIQQMNRNLWIYGTPAFYILLLLIVLLAGCGGLWFDPDDPEEVDLACGDLRATMATCADAMLTSEEATAEEAERIGAFFTDTAAAMRDEDPEAGKRAMNVIVAELVDEPRLLGMYQRILGRIVDRIDAHLQAMDLADSDDAARQVARKLTIAALEGAAEGARDYARAASDEG